MTDFNTSDDPPPSLTAFSIPTVDVTQGSRPPVATIAVSDPGSNYATVVLTLDHPLLFSLDGGHGGVVYQPSEQLRYEIDGTTVGSYAIVNAAAASGTYAISQAVVTDAAGSITYSGADLDQLGFSTNLEVIGDTTPPMLTSFAISLAGDPTDVVRYTFDVGVSDIAMARAVIHLDRPVIAADGTTTQDVVIDHGTGFNTLPGYFDTAKIGFATLTDSELAPGAYNVTGVTIMDYAGNEANYTPAQLAALGDPTGFTVSTEPRLTSFRLPSAVDVRSSVHTIPVQATVTDTGSTANQIVLTLDHAVEDAGQPNHGLHDPTPTTTITSTFYSDGTLVTYPVLDPDTDAGHYIVVTATVTDHAGGTTTYTTAQLAALGFSTDFDVLSDNTAPAVSALSMPAAVLAGEAIIISVGGTDPSPGTGIVSGFLQLVGPDGTIQNIGINEYIGYNTYHGGVGEVRAVLSVPGTYSVSGITLTDYAGNTATYDTAELVAQGYNTSIVVAQAGELPQAAITGDFAYTGTAGADDLFLNGNVRDYALSRVAGDFYSGDEPSRLGDFVLTGLNGSGAFSIGETIETVHFQNGQYLALNDLPAYLEGSAALSLGGAGDDQLFQSRLSGYEEFVGGAGNDQLYLKGNVHDYAVRAVSAVSTPDGTQLSGLELVGLNGSGALVIDGSVDTVHFQNGQYLALGDVTHYVQAADASTGVLHLLPDELAAGSVTVAGSANANDILLLNGNAGDYTLSRGQTSGAFVLSGDGHVVAVDQTIDTVQFGNGQYLALHDLPAYLNGDAVFTSGTDQDDLLFAAAAGDQYVTGGGGTDALYLDGNTSDYTLQPVHLSAGFDYDTPDVPFHSAIDGVELVGTNGSGNIYIDQSVETIHFQNGQYLAFNDLHAYIG